MKSKMTSVKVAVRVRPRNKREDDSATIIAMEGQKTRITNCKAPETGERGDHARLELKQREFTFDHSFWSVDPTDSHFVSQNQVFESLGPEVVEAVYEGYNLCVFTYGQTGSGKTFTMMGTQSDPGFIPRFCEVLFGRMNDTDCTYRTQVSFLEIYNETVRDLLKSGSKADHKLRIREHPVHGPYVQGLSQHTVVSFQSIIQLISRGNNNRVTASTRMNDVSSRSHAIFTITFTQAKLQDGLPSERQSKIHLVDLAGSERASASGSSGVRLQEGGNINKSLVTLGSVISALADMAERSGSRRSSSFIPYRDSKLTYLLRDSLGGNSHTIMVATISPSALNYGESLSTLKYANRAKNIINKPTVNEDPNVQLICELRKEIARLKALLATNADGPSEQLPDVHEELQLKECRMKVLTDEWTDKWQQAAAILQEEKTLELRKEGQGVILDSSLPHLISLEDDVYSTGIMLYHIKRGLTKIGTVQSLETQDIVISGEEARPDHCVIEYVGGEVTLHPIEEASCSVNGVTITTPLKLNQGALIQLGRSSVFRFNFPEEAEKLKQIRKSLSTLSLSKSPSLTASRTDLLSRSLTELYLSTDSLPLSPGHRESMPKVIGTKTGEDDRQVVMCDSSINIQPLLEREETENCNSLGAEDVRRKTQEMEESHREQERKWQAQQRHLEEQLANKEQELSVLQDCMQMVSQTLTPQQKVENALQKLVEQEQERLRETQHTRQQLVEALQEVGANFAASECSLQMALGEVEKMLTSNQMAISAIQEENQIRFKYLIDELCMEREKAEAAEEQVVSLQHQVEKEKNRLLGQDSGLKNAHSRLTQAILRLCEEHRLLDQEKTAHWNHILCRLQEQLPDNGTLSEQSMTEHSTAVNEMDTTDEQNNNNNQYRQQTRIDNIHDLQLHIKAAEDRFGSNCPALLRKVKSEVETWKNQKDNELRRLEKKRNDLFLHHSKRLASLSQQTEATESDLRSQQEKCRHLKQVLKQLNAEVTQGVQELQEEQRQLQELRERKVQEAVVVAEEKVEREKEIEGRMKEVQDTADAEMNRLRMERERLLGLLHDHGLKDNAIAENNDDDDTSSSFSTDSAASEILLEKQRELEKKTQECLDLRKKITALQQEVTSCREQHSEQLQARLNNLEQEKQMCLTAAVVEQQVRLRLFAESVERQQQRRSERAQVRAEREREVQSLKERHQEQVDQLKAALNSSDVQCQNTQTQTSSSSKSYRKKLARQLSYGSSSSTVEISIPNYALRGAGHSSHYEYEVKMSIGAEMWSVFRRFSQFKELHEKMKKINPKVNFLVFPKCRFFHKTEKVAAERRIILERYLQDLVKLCRQDPQCPLHPDNHPLLSKHVLGQFDSFFRRGLFETARHIAY